MTGRALGAASNAPHSWCICRPVSRPSSGTLGCRWGVGSPGRASSCMRMEHIAPATQVPNARCIIANKVMCRPNVPELSARGLVPKAALPGAPACTAGVPVLGLCGAEGVRLRGPSGCQARPAVACRLDVSVSAFGAEGEAGAGPLVGWCCSLRPPQRAGGRCPENGLKCLTPPSTAPWHSRAVRPLCIARTRPSTPSSAQPAPATRPTCASSAARLGALPRPFRQPEAGSPLPKQRRSSVHASGSVRSKTTPRRALRPAPPRTLDPGHRRRYQVRLPDSVCALSRAGRR